MPSPAAIVTGYAELLLGLRAQPAAVRREIRGAFRAIGDTLVRPQASAGILGLNPPSAKTAAGYRTVVRGTGLTVEQSLRKTTGRRPDWGMNQMKYGLYPAVDDNLDEIVLGVDEAMQRAAGILGA